MGDTNVRYTLSLSDLLSGKLSQASGEAQRLDGHMGNLQGTIGKVAGALGIAFGIQQIKNMGMAVIDAGSKVEDARVGLTTMLKDAAQARQVISNTMEDATTTPFAFEGLLQANKALISANVNAKEARATVLDLANAIAASGGGDVELQRMVFNLQQIKNLGKASAVDIKQFGIAGINIYEALARAFGKHAEDMKGVEVTYDQLRYALKKAHDEGGLYANGLENMANNTSVGISNLGDAMFKLKVDIFNELKPAITELIATGMDAIAWLRSSWEWTYRNREMLLGLAKGVLIGVAVFKAYKLAIQAAVVWQKIQWASINLLGDGFLKANAATKLFAGGLNMIGTAVKANPIGLLVTVIGSLAAAYFAFSGSAKDATRENDKLNMSLMESITSSTQRREQWIDVIDEKLKGMNAANRLKEFRAEVDAEGKTLLQAIDANKAKMESKIFDQRVGMQTYAVAKADREAIEKENRGYFAELDVLERFKKQGFKRRRKTDDNGTIPPPAPTSGKSSSKVTGSRSVNIKIDIGNLINEFTVKTTTINESTKKITELVTQALLAAVNDSQNVAGA